MIVQPLPYALLGQQAEDAHAVLCGANAVESHDVPCDAPDILPVRVEELPPATAGR